MYIINYPHLKVKKIVLAGSKASRILETLARGLAGFSGDSIDPFYNISPFDQEEKDSNITSVVNCASEEYIKKEECLLQPMMLMTVNSYLGPLEVMTQQKKKMMKRLRTVKLNLM